MARRHNPTGSPHQTCPREFQASSGMSSSGLACTSTSSTTKTSRTKAVDRVVEVVPRFRIGSIRTSSTPPRASGTFRRTLAISFSRRRPLRAHRRCNRRANDPDLAQFHPGPRSGTCSTSSSKGSKPSTRERSGAAMATRPKVRTTSDFST